MRQRPGDGVPRRALAAIAPAPLIGLHDAAGEHRPIGLHPLANDFQAEVIQTSERGQVRASGIAAGRSAAMFAVLAGIGIAFMTGRRQVTGTDRRAVAASLAVRALIIGSIGLALGYADSDLTSVILAYYAILFLLAVPLTFLPNWALAVTAVIVGVGMPVLGHVLRTDLPPASGENPSFELLVQDPGQLLTELTLTGVYPALPWMAYIATGLLVGRLHLSSTRVATILLVAGAAMVVIVSVASWWLMDPLGGLDQLCATAPAAGMTAHDVDDMLIWGSGGTTPTTTWWWLATTRPRTPPPQWTWRTPPASRSPCSAACSSWPTRQAATGPYSGRCWTRWA